MSMLYPFHVRLTKIFEDIAAGKLVEAEKGIREHLNSGPVGVQTAEGLFTLLIHHSKAYEEHLLNALKLLEESKRLRYRHADEAGNRVLQAINKGRTIMVIIQKISEELKKDLNV